MSIKIITLEEEESQNNWGYFCDPEYLPQETKFKQPKPRIRYHSYVKSNNPIIIEEEEEFDEYDHLISDDHNTLTVHDSSYSLSKLSTLSILMASLYYIDFICTSVKSLFY